MKKSTPIDINGMMHIFENMPTTFPDMSLDQIDNSIEATKTFCEGKLIPITILPLNKSGKGARSGVINDIAYIDSGDSFADESTMLRALTCAGTSVANENSYHTEEDIGCYGYGNNTFKFTSKGTQYFGKAPGTDKIMHGYYRDNIETGVVDFYDFESDKAQWAIGLHNEYHAGKNTKAHEKVREINKANFKDSHFTITFLEDLKDIDGFDKKHPASFKKKFRSGKPSLCYYKYPNVHIRVGGSGGYEIVSKDPLEWDGKDVEQVLEKTFSFEEGDLDCRISWSKKRNEVKVYYLMNNRLIQECHLDGLIYGNLMKKLKPYAKSELQGLRMEINFTQKLKKKFNVDPVKSNIELHSELKQWIVTEPDLRKAYDEIKILNNKETKARTTASTKKLEKKLSKIVNKFVKNKGEEIASMGTKKSSTKSTSSGKKPKPKTGRKNNPRGRNVEVSIRTAHDGSLWDYDLCSGQIHVFIHDNHPFYKRKYDLLNQKGKSKESFENLAEVVFTAFKTALAEEAGHLTPEHLAWEREMDSKLKMEKLNII